MAISWPFNSTVTQDTEGNPIYSRAYNADVIARVLKKYFRNGVFSDDESSLQVLESTGMTVDVAPGDATINGHHFYEETTRTLTVQAASATLDRIDSVVLRLNLSIDTLAIDLYVVQGTAAETPTAPTLTRNSSVYEIGLANLFIAKNTTTITQQRITDTRLDSARCGVVASIIGDTDTSTYYAQLAEVIAQAETTLINQIVANQATMDDFLSAVEGSLGENAAGNLLNLINKYRVKNATVTLLVNDWSESGGVYTQTKSVSIITADCALSVSPAWESREAYNDAEVGASSAAAGSVTFTASIIPADEITVKLSVANSTGEAGDPLSGYGITADMVTEDGGGSVQDALDAHTSQLADIAEIAEVTRAISVNLFDLSDSDLQQGGIYPNSVGFDTAYTNNFGSGFIPASKGDAFVFPKSNILSLNAGLYATLFASDKITRVSSYGSTIVNNGNGTVTYACRSDRSDIAYIRINGDISMLGTFMVVRNATYPPYFIGFGLQDSVTLSDKMKSEIRHIDQIGKIWAAIGDSLTEKNTTASVNYTDLIVSSLGLTCYNYGISGSGYKKKDDVSQSFYQRVLAYDRLATADVITIFGSGNDVGLMSDPSALGDAADTDTTTICGCINATLDNIYSWNVGAKIGIITPTPWSSWNPSVDNNNMALYSQKLIDIANRRSIPYLDLYHRSNLRPWVTENRVLYFANSDGVHPNNAGHLFIAPAIREFIKSII